MNALTAISNPVTSIQIASTAREDQQVRSNQGPPPPLGKPESAPTTDSSRTDGSAPSLTETAEITIDGLLEAWGTDNPRYDLNGDGNVNIDDLFALLAKMADDMKPPEDNPEAFTDLVEPPQTPPPASVAQADALDTPVVSDDPALTPTAESGNGIVESGEMPQTQSQPPLTIDNLLDAWGSDNPQFDLNGDGKVDIDDLFALLGKMAEDLRDGDGPPPPLGAPENESRLALDSTRARSLADTLIDKLSEVGFNQRPPTSLPSLIDLMDLGPQYKAEVMERLSEFYQQGLGVDYVG